MTIEYSVYRNLNLSIIKGLQDLVPEGVSVVDETVEDLVTSTIGVYPGPISHRPFEQGNSDDMDDLAWFIGVYANAPNERDYLQLLVFNKLKNWTISVLDFSNSEAVLGSMFIENLRAEPRHAPKEEIDKLRYFSLISFQTTYQEA